MSDWPGYERGRGAPAVTALDRAALDGQYEQVEHPAHYNSHPALTCKVKCTAAGVYQNLTGQCFTRLRVLERVRDGRRNTRWRCLCDPELGGCGGETIAISGNLLNRTHKSCGCLLKGLTSWKAVERIFQDGYAFLKVPEHPRANPHTGRVREHILVMEEKLGRYLLPGETVHHKNTIRAGNSPGNLELWTSAQPPDGRVTDKVQWAKDLLKLYEPESLTENS